jgi:phosphotransferase system enzyme I (PtsP)
MIAEVAEFERARRILDMELAREKAAGGKLPRQLRVGAMVEVPSLLWQLPALLERADFISVGSNDLIQFLFAADRGDPRLSDRFDSLSPVVLAVLRDLVRAANRAEVPISLCGEMAGRPLEAMALVGLGYRALSMTASNVGPVKEMVHALRLRPLANYLGTLLNAPDHSLRDKLRAFARDHHIPV